MTELEVFLWFNILVVFVLLLVCMLLLALIVSLIRTSKKQTQVPKYKSPMDVCAKKGNIDEPLFLCTTDDRTLREISEYFKENRNGI